MNGRLALGWVAKSERDVQRIRILSELLSGRRTVGSAAAVLEITERQARRLLDRLRDGGGGAIGHAFVKARQDAPKSPVKVKSASEAAAMCEPGGNQAADRGSCPRRIIIHPLP
jgi:hypothetical protein